MHAPACVPSQPSPPGPLLAQGYRGIVLVSPAIFAPRGPRQSPVGSGPPPDPRLEAVERVLEADDDPAAPADKPWAQRLRLCARAVQFAVARVLLRLIRPVVVLVLRSRIRKKGWVGLGGRGSKTWREELAASPAA